MANRPLESAMPRTVVGLNDAKAIKRYSAFLALDTAKMGYFNKRFMGYGDTASTPIQMLSQLESDAGEQISYDLTLQLKMQPVEGDNTLEGQEEDLKFFSDQVYIDQMRCGVNTGGRMTRKRTVHDLRATARRRQGEWWSRIFDELFFLYLSGPTAGATTGFQNTGYILPNTYAGFANNSFAAPDSSHIMYGLVGGAKNTITTAHTMTRTVVERVSTKADAQGGGTENIPQLQPIMIDGEEHFVLVMHSHTAYDLRVESGAGGWLEIQKSLTTAQGGSNPIFKGGLGMLNNVVLHKHKNVLKFGDYGAGSNVVASRALFMGEQAAVCAFGSPGTNLRFDWHEETRDNGNQVVISSSSIFGIKKTRFNSQDYGLFAVDVASADPG